MSLEEDVAAEGEPEKEFYEGIAARMPRKRVAAGLLIRDEVGRVLFVIPTYKDTLDIPGGVAEPDESPAAACRREVREELGIDIDPGPLLVVDWVPSHGVWGDSIQFVFDGGVLAPDQIDGIKNGDGEISGIIFLYPEEASDRVRPSFHRRITEAFTRATNPPMPIYAEFGRIFSVRTTRPGSGSEPL